MKNMTVVPNAPAERAIDLDEVEVEIETATGELIRTTWRGIESCRSDYLDAAVHTWRRYNNYNLAKVFVDCDGEVFKRTFIGMRNQNYNVPPKWVHDARGDEFLRQLDYLSLRPLLKQRAIADGLVYIEAGEFMMGSPLGEVGRYTDEDQRLVKLTRPFWYQATHVTQRQWRELMGNNPSQFRYDGPDGELADDRPVEMVSWHDAAAYCNAFSRKKDLPEYYDLSLCTGRPGSGNYTGPTDIATRPEGMNSYRLPSEAEQQRVRRGNDPATATLATYAPAGKTLADIAWYRGNSGDRSHPVGLLLPTNEGVYDGIGNVYGWVDDYYAKCLPEPGSGGKLVDPTGPSGPAAHRVFSGGGFSSDDRGVRAAARHHDNPSARHGFLGFRPARFVPQASGALRS